MTDILATRAPESVWRYFSEISAIPRCSRKEQRVRDYVAGVAKRLGVPSHVDRAGNIVVTRPPAPGLERVPTIVLQGHLDMVCEKNNGVTHDFDNDPIALVVDGEWLRAERTTLGADNGIAVAMMLAILELDEPMGRIECLFTVDEETGLTGATQLDPGVISGRLLINLDNEEEGYFCIGCAGGRTTDLTVQGDIDANAPADLRRLTIEVTGLHGGHSGMEIHRGYTNAITVAARLARAARSASSGLRLVAVEGGGKHNAIPRECTIQLALPDSQLEPARQAVATAAAAITTECAVIDPDLKILVDDSDSAGQPLTTASSAALIDMLVALPHGVLAMSQTVEGLVETSTNLASVHLADGAVRVLTSQRGFSISGIDWATERVATIARLAGGSASASSEYPPWTPKRDNELADRAQSVYRSLFGSDAQVIAVHAGLECGVIGDKIEEMQMVSFGPDIRGAHTPEERLHIESTARTWQLLRGVLTSYTNR